jgi:hypothetical protein
MTIGVCGPWVGTPAKIHCCYTQTWGCPRDAGQAHLHLRTWAIWASNRAPKNLGPRFVFCTWDSKSLGRPCAGGE